MSYKPEDGTADFAAGDSAPRAWWTTNRAGDTATVSAGILFLLVCMMLPLVGPAAAAGSGSPGAMTADHFETNRMAFSSALALTTLLGFAAAVMKFSARRIDGGGFPRAAVSLVVLCLALTVAYAMGLLTI